MIIVSVILFVVWCITFISSLVLPCASNVVGGNSSRSTDVLTPGHSYFVKSFRVPEYNDQWLTGDLTADYPQCPYILNGKIFPEKLRVTNLKIKKLRKLHWGQRKLLLSEIDFLSTNASLKQLVV